MTSNELKDNVLLAVTIVLVLAIAGGIILVGQALRNERAETVTAGEYTTTIQVPAGFICEGQMLKEAGHFYVVRCSPWR